MTASFTQLFVQSCSNCPLGPVQRAKYVPGHHDLYSLLVRSINETISTLQGSKVVTAIYPETRSTIDSIHNLGR